MSPRTPLDRVIDLAFGVPIAATAFAREATRLAVHKIVDSGGARSTPERAAGDGGEPTPPSTSEAADGAADGSSEPVLPFDGYDTMSAQEIIVAIDDLDDAGLALVETYEGRTRRRRTVLVKVATMRTPTTS